MAENIVIEIDAEIGPGLTRALDILEKLGVASKKDADAFRELKVSSDQLAASQANVQKEVTKTDAALKDVAKAVDGLVKKPPIEPVKPAQLGLVENLKKRINDLGTALDKSQDPTKIDRINTLLAKQRERLEALTRVKPEIIPPRQLGLVENLQIRLQKLAEARDRSQDPTKVARMNTILETQGQRLRELQGATQQAGKGLGGLDSALKNIGSQVIAAFAVQQVVAFGKEAANLSAKFNSIKNAINFVQGDAEKGAAAFDFLTELSERLGLELVSTANAFKLFSASSQLAGIGAEETKNIFESVATATTTLGLTAEDTNGVFLALSQIISKGTVQAEELRGQIGERLPGAFELAAKSMGVTTKQLNKMLEQGQVLSKDFLPKFAAQLKETFSGGLEEASRGAQANLNRITNAFTTFKVEVGNTINAVIAQGFKLFNDSQEETIQKSGELARANYANATSAKTLLAEYESLTRDGVTPNAQQKNRLKEITYQLRDALGESVVSIDKETGALILNKNAVREAIKQKLLLANQEASTRALQLDQLNQQKEVAQLTTKQLTEERKLLESQATDAGLDVKNLVLRNDFTKLQLDLFGKLDTLSVKEADNKIKLRDIERQRLVLIKELKTLNFNEADIQNLFGENNKPEEDIQKTIKSIESLNKKLKELRDKEIKIDVLTPANPLGKTDFDKLAGIDQLRDVQKQIEAVQKEIDELTGKLRKKSSDKELSEREKALRKLHELEVKAFEDNLSERAKQIDKIVALEQEKHLRIQEIVEQFAKATGADLNDVLSEFDKTGRIDLSKVFSTLENFKAPEGEMEKFSKALGDIIEKFTTLQTAEIQNKNVNSLKDQFKDAFEFIENKADEAADAIDKKFIDKKIQLIAEFKLTGQTPEDFARLQNSFAEFDRHAKQELLQNAIDAAELELKAAEKKNEELKRLGEQQLIDTAAIQKKIVALKNAATQQEIDAIINSVDQRITEEQRAQDAIKDMIIPSVQNLLGSIQTIYDNHYQKLSDAIQDNLDKTLDSYDRELSANEDLHSKKSRGDRKYEEEKKRLLDLRTAAEDKASKEQRKIAREQAIKNKEFAVLNATLSGIQGVTRALADYPFPYSAIVAGIVGGLALAEVAAAASAPVPAYAKGVEVVKGKGTETSDEVHARLSVGERVVTAEKNRRFYTMLSAIHNERIDPESANQFAKFSPEQRRLLVKTDPVLLKELITMKPAMLKANIIETPKPFRRDIAEQLVAVKEVRYTVETKAQEFDELAMLRVMDKANERFLKQLDKVIEKKLQNMKDPYSRHR